jgi:hypothetical protein
MTGSSESSWKMGLVIGALNIIKPDENHDLKQGPQYERATKHLVASASGSPRRSGPTKPNLNR